MSSVRAHILFIIFGLAIAALGGRLFSLQIVERGFWSAMAKGQQQLHEEILPERGAIFFKDKNGELFPVAMNQTFPMLYAIPKEIKDPKKTAEFLANVFSAPPDQFFSALVKEDDPYEPLRHRLSDEQARVIKEANIEGLALKDERLRSYPQKNRAAHVLGFVGYLDGEERGGAYGIEGAFESYLRGKKGLISGEKDVVGRLISFLGEKVEEPKPGADIVLTIDPNIQFAAESALKKAFERWQADRGDVIVMDPKDGAILAMASLPDFDPNAYERVSDAGIFMNANVSHLFEPGSVFKPFTMAAAIDAGVLTPYTTYENTNQVAVENYTITNVVQEKIGQVSMIEVLENSLNTGAVFAEQQLTHERFLHYLERFGFDEPTGIELPGEQKNNLANLKEVRDINYATASFGQGIALTPLSLLRSLAVIANGGRLVSPYIVQEIRPYGAPPKLTEPEPPRQVIDTKTATDTAAMMVSVVRNGTGNRARIPGFTIAGKTGTAEVPSKDKRGYESGNTIHSFGGFAPAFDPRFIVLVKLDYPKGVRYAETSVVPAFREIAEFVLSYYGVLPDDAK